MFAGADYYIRHNDEAVEPKTTVSFEEMPLNRIADLATFRRKNEA